MSKREDDMVVASKKPVDFHQIDSERCSVAGDPEEGYRLMRAFLGIRRPGLRQAIVELVTELSLPSDEAS